MVGGGSGPVCVTAGSWRGHRHHGRPWECRRQERRECCSGDDVYPGLPDRIRPYGLVGRAPRLAAGAFFFADELSFGERLYASALPVLSLAAGLATPTYRTIRAALRAELGAPYVEMARLKGLSEARILLVHVLPNAVAPIVNGLVQLIGKLLVHAVVIRDIPLVLACSLVCAVAYVGLVLLADILTVATNPRLRQRPASASTRFLPAAKPRRRPPA